MSPHDIPEFADGFLVGFCAAVVLLLAIEWVVRRLIAVGEDE